ncbi:MAG TPA: DNA-3-methyladenine glycosylase, partial [Bacteroidales bacterium]|nr:DNA-3-methyladenine glycosylase [Bacteroidales bacterium]
MRLSDEFFRRDAKTVAVELLGKELVRHFDNNYTIRLIINETEAYVGEHDLACHASKGRTRRTEPMFLVGGILYVYLVYGMHFMLNVVTGAEN